ncbi:hypothetical protein N7471_001361 [Penicillium samsonianum]|uniref:uncharacterized protein n=1 Tax=Penicillium samsonianum TaxID=1882272 RepID=UPI0025476DD2|nr:uncharacterized protein N7471_001361 [Penicillium samsonianum]KAJ6150162.1 hypothetical protein N7471_001361 [Penicillium samsonianum]
MNLLLTLVMFTAAVSACSGPAFRCKKAQGSKSGDYSRTSEICAEIGNGADMCYCYGAAEDYCSLASGADVKTFQDDCEADPGWYYAAC